MEKKKILIVTPILPFPMAGAEQIDRAAGVLQLKNLGYNVKVIAKIASWQDKNIINEAVDYWNVPVALVPYKYSNRKLSTKDKIVKAARRVINPLFLDGAAFEYSDYEIKEVLDRELSMWKPDLVWFDYTYLWPLYNQVKLKNVPIVTRSINFEALHFLQEDGVGLWNLLKSLPKFLTELIVVKKSDHIFAITPKEEKMYRKFGAKNISTLALRGLPACIRQNHSIKERMPLKVFFMGSTYNVSHNRRALEFVIKDIAPYFHKNYFGQFEFYVLGKKVPDDYKKYLIDNVIYGGSLYGQDLEGFLSDMDIAFIPSFFGAGMQQKIFEPLSRGIPTITSKRGIADYPFMHKKHVYLAHTFEEYVSGLLYLKDSGVRKLLSRESLSLAEDVFSQKNLNDVVLSALSKIVN